MNRSAGDQQRGDDESQSQGFHGLQLEGLRYPIPTVSPRGTTMVLSHGSQPSARMPMVTEPAGSVK